MSSFARSAAGAASFQIRSTAGRTLSSQIVACIRDALFNGELNPGDVVGSESELAERFGVSRLCVRDALRSLEAMGIVVIRMGATGGARIAQPDLERFSDALSIQLALLRIEADDIAEAEAAIESMTAELAARNATAQDLADIRRLLDEAEQALDDPARSDRLGREFHLAVAHASHNTFLEAQLQAFRSGVWRSVGYRAMTRSVAEAILRTHRELFDKIRRKDADGARKLMNEHVSTIRGKGLSGKARRRGGKAQTDVACLAHPRSPRSHR